MNNLNFRAWHKEEKRMMFVLGIDATDGNEMTYFHCFWDFKNDEGENLTFMPSDWFNADEVILMQSTGLKDSKGVEIFDGDIISDAQGVSTLGRKCDETGAQGYLHSSEVKINHCGVHTFDDMGNYIQLGIEGQDVFEVDVIGNIYEQPELLGGGV